MPVRFLLLRDFLGGLRELQVGLLYRCLPGSIHREGHALCQRVVDVALDDEGVLLRSDHDMGRAIEAFARKRATCFATWVQGPQFIAIVLACGQRITTEPLALGIVTEVDRSFAFTLANLLPDLQKQSMLRMTGMIRGDGSTQGGGS